MNNEEVVPGLRIYVIVPHKVQVPKIEAGGDGTPQEVLGSIYMEPGRLMAQVAHVVSRMRLHHLLQKKMGIGPITTIVLSVRNSKELKKVFEDLWDYGVNVTAFEDHNEPFYGTPNPVLTAICTAPVKKIDVDAAIVHLELYS